MRLCKFPGVRGAAFLESLPTPRTTELLRVDTSVAVGAPAAALPLAVAPIAPDPLVPVVSTPEKLTTVMDDRTLCDSVAVTLTLLTCGPANARQISDVPLCLFVRTASTHVKPPPVTLVT